MARKDIGGITEAAAILYRHGVPFKKAVEDALDQYHIKNPEERDVLKRNICSNLGSRGAQKKAALAKAPARVPVQLKLKFRPPRKR